MTNFANEDFQATLENEEITDFSDTQDTDNMYNIFQTKLLKAIDKHAPYKTLSQKEVKMRKKPWITKQILTKIREKSKAYEKYLKSKDILWYNRYINSRNTVKRLIEKSKRNYYRNYFLENYKQSKNIWHKINEILRNKSKQLEDVFLNENGMILTNQVIVSEQFNKYLVPVAQNLVDGIGQTANKFQDYLKNLNKHSMFLKEVEPGEI